MNTWTRRLAPLLLLAITVLQLGAGPAAHVKATVETAPGASSPVLHVRIKVPAGLHAQSHTPLDESLIPLVVTVDPNPAVRFDATEYPPPQLITFAAMGQVSCYTGTVDVTVPFTLVGALPANSAGITGSVRYQACNDNSCFPPKTIHFRVAMTGDGGPSTAPATAPTTAATAPAALLPAASPPASSPPPAEPTVAATTVVATTGPTMIFGHDITTVGAPFLFGAAFVIGIMFNAVPCVLPVVPLKIVGWYEASHHDRRKSIALGSAFSVGVVAVFGLLAVLIVALRVLNWGGLFTHTWFIVTMILVLLAVAVSQMGFFEFRLPTAAYGFDPRHDTLSGNFLFGILTAFLSTPCTIGAFSGVMAWALKQPASIGVAAIITVGLGMAFPYFILSGFPEVARRFPRVGPWPELIKQEMGILLLAVVIFLARPLLPGAVGDKVLYWGLFLVLVAALLFLMGRTLAITAALRPRLIVGAIAVAVLLPASFALRLFTAEPYEWQPYTDAGLAAARASGKPVVVDFTADWCINCKADEKWVLNDHRIFRTVKDAHAVMIKADVTHDTAPALPLLGQLDPAGAIPLLAVYLPNSSTPKLLGGLYTVADVQQMLRNAGG